MDIKLLPPQSRCLVDANILLYHIGGSSLECKDFLQRVANEEIEAYLTTIIVAEALHRQMLIEAVAKGLVTPGKALSKLKSNPALISSLTDYITEVENSSSCLSRSSRSRPQTSPPATRYAPRTDSSSTTRLTSPVPIASDSPTSSLTTPTSVTSRA